MKSADFGRLFLGLALIAGLLMALAHRDSLGEAAVGEWLAQSGGWAPLAFISLYALATVVFLPGSALTLVAGALFGPMAGALYSLAGATLGATVAFLVSRHLVGERVSRKLGGRIGRFMEGVDAEGWRFVAFVRLVPLFPFNLVNYALGLTRIRLAPYVLASAACMVPGALAYAWLGHAGRQAVSGADSAVGSVMLALALVAVVAFLPRLVMRLKSADAIAPRLLQELLHAGGIQVVDVRRASEFGGAAGFIRGARNVPLEELPGQVDQLGPWRDGGLVLICRTQMRSGHAARLLAARGFANVRIVQGGMKAWAELGYPTETCRAPAKASRKFAE